MVGAGTIPNLHSSKSDHYLRRQLIKLTFPVLFGRRDHNVDLNSATSESRQFNGTPVPRKHMRKRRTSLDVIFDWFYVTGGEKSSLNQDSNPGPLAYCAKALSTELLRPDILTDSHTPVNPCDMKLIGVSGNQRRPGIGDFTCDMKLIGVTGNQRRPGIGDFTVPCVSIKSGLMEQRKSLCGHPSGSRLWPRGICTDALSHILVCDDRTNTVQMLDRDGEFLSHLLIRPSGRFSPHSLSYDVNTHRLWVGSRYNKTVVIYRYITRQNALTDPNPATADVMESLSEIPTTGTEKTQQGNQCLLKLMSPPELLHSLTVTGVDECYHISCVTSDRVWVSGRNNLMLTDTTGVPLHHVEDSCRGYDRGLHTVNSESELIYINRNYNINKLSKDMKTTTSFIAKTNFKWNPWCVYIKRTDFTWIPQCVYWSPSTGDLLVGMYTFPTGKVTRYNQSGQLTQTIQNDNTGLGLYSVPKYITENNNGDVVVSDSDFISIFGTVVVTERGGRHRFSYNGHPSGSGLDPRGICTDPLSHILVCDGRTKTVQMLDMDGQFLSHLLTRPSGRFSPWSLSYDVNTHRLWVGSEDNNTVVIYRYITRQDALTDEHTPRPDGDAMPSSTPAV
nr:uncharacterized protein LOC105323939 [Crassostrea gigas]